MTFLSSIFGWRTVLLPVLSGRLEAIGSTHFGKTCPTSIFRWMLKLTSRCLDQEPGELSAMTVSGLLCLLTSAALRNGARRSAGALRFQLLMAAVVWFVWLVFGGRPAVAHLIGDWRVAATMIAGSFVGGGTSGGGGAIAFPVFTKLLHVAPRDARNFSLAIQSVGMGAATLSIFYLRIPIERRALSYAGLSGVIGVTLGTCFIAPHIPPALVRTLFTVLVSSMGIALLLVNREKHSQRNQVMSEFRSEEKAILCLSGLVGGVISALIGTGENTVLFIVLVLLFRVNEKVVTPTTVILMTMVTIPGFLLHLLLLRDVSSVVMGYWLAAVPIAVAMAPLGALICSHMKRQSIVKVLLSLIALEVVSTIVLVPITRLTLWTSLGALMIFGAIELLMSRTRRYLPENLNVSVGLEEGVPQFAHLR